MYLVLFIFWIVLNANITLEIILFGLVFATALFWFLCRYMDYSWKKELNLLKKIPAIIHYGIVLVFEIVKANFATIRLILTSKNEIEPALVEFKAPLKTPEGKAFLANAITLTPGTITVSLEGDTYLVHCLDQELAEGMDSSVFVEKLAKLEGSQKAGKGGRRG